MTKYGRLAIVLSGVAMFSSASAIAWADTVPAPPGSAEAVAAGVDGVAAVSHTEAEATPTGGSATANVVELGGEPPAEQLGGTQNGTGSSSGTVIDTGEGQPARAQVAPWQATVADANGCHTSDGQAAVARAGIEGAVNVDVLQSSSHAEHCGLASKGAGSTDGAVVDVGGGALHAVVLHSEAVSGGKGHTFVASLNGNEIFNDDQAGGACTVDVPGLLRLACLIVGGGQGTVFANLADVGLGGAAVHGGVFQASATPAAGTPGATSAGAPALEAGPAASSPAGPALEDQALAAPESGRSNLAFTGHNLIFLALVSLAVAALGGAVLAMVRTWELAGAELRAS